QACVAHAFLPECPIAFQAIAIGAAADDIKAIMAQPILQRPAIRALEKDNAVLLADPFELLLPVFGDVDHSAQDAAPFRAFRIGFYLMSRPQQAEIHVSQAGILAYAKKAHT